MFDAATAFICNKEKFLVANSQPHLLNLIQPKGGYNQSIKSLLPVSVRARQGGGPWVAAARVWGTRGVGTGERERGAGEEDRGLERRGWDRRPLAYSTLA